MRRIRVDDPAPEDRSRIDDLELVDPAVAFALERHANDLTVEVGMHLRQKLCESECLTLFDVATVLRG